MQKTKYLGVSIVILVIGWLLLQLPLFNSLNNLVLDLLSGQTEARQEIVIVGIDDNSLQQLGSWPWDRKIFTTALDNLAQHNPQVIGMDILFLEERAGDESLKSWLVSPKVPVVMGSKLIDGAILRSIFETDSGFVNFQPDFDGKIRHSLAYTDKPECELSFALALTAHYFNLSDSKKLCNPQLKFRNDTYQLDNNREIRFAYTRERFTQISFADVYNNKITADQIKDKVVLIGSVALDLRSGLNDNFTDIFGRTIPGIEIHANIINSFLNETFYSAPNILVVFFIVLAILLMVNFSHLYVRSSLEDLAIFVGIFIVNLFATFVLLQFNTLWPVLPISLLIILNYIYTLLYRYLLKNRENRYIRQAFGKYVNPKLLQQLLANPAQLTLGGETRKMTVLFSDIRSFTTISEGMKPKELVSMVNDYLSYMSNIILTNDGTIDKYIGDAIMAFWNAPLDDEQHAKHAVDTALAMQKQVVDFGEAYPNYPRIHIGIGINSGEMTVGNVGGIARFDYTVLGDNVNLGSRLEGLTKKYNVTIICSEAVVKEYKGEEVIFRLLDEVKVKGKNASVKIYEPLEETNKNANKKAKYEQAFKYYQQGDFKSALKLLDEIPFDGPAVQLKTRIEELQKPPKDWDGVWKWDEK